MPNAYSVKPTFPKNSIVSLSRAMTMPVVVSTDTAARGEERDDRLAHRAGFSPTLREASALGRADMRASSATAVACLDFVLLLGAHRHDLRRLRDLSAGCRPRTATKPLTSGFLSSALFTYMKIGRPSGLYEPSWIVWALGSTQPPPPSTLDRVELVLVLLVEREPEVAHRAFLALDAGDDLVVVGRGLDALLALHALLTVDLVGEEVEGARLAARGEQGDLLVRELRVDRRCTSSPWRPGRRSPSAGRSSGSRSACPCW